MAARPQKRARATSSGQGLEPGTDPARAAKLPKILATLDDHAVRTLLLDVASHDPSVATLIETRASRIKKAEQAKVIDFDYHSKSVWKTINVTYSKLSGSKQYYASGDAFNSIKRAIEDIRARCPAHASFGTKVNALETLRKIGKSVALSAGDTMAREIQVFFQHDTILEDTMLGIVESMTLEEREITSDEPHEDITWVEKLEELTQIAEGRCLFEGLADVIALLVPSSEEDTKDGEKKTGKLGSHLIDAEDC